MSDYPFYVTFNQIENSFINIETRFAQLIFSYKNSFTPTLFPSFVQNVYELNETILYAINNNQFGEQWNPQLTIMSDALNEMLGYFKHYFNITPSLTF